MGTTNFPKQASEPEFVTKTYQYRFSYSAIDTFPNGTPTKSSFKGTYNTTSGYGITADVSKSGYTAVGILDAYGFFTVSGATTMKYPTTESFLDGNTLKMKTDGATSSWNSWDFKVKIKYVKN
jgi:hypothetical protein